MERARGEGVSKSMNIPSRCPRNQRQLADDGDENPFPYSSKPSSDFEDEKEMHSLRSFRATGNQKVGQKHLLEVDLPEGVLNLGSIVLRDVHVLRKFDVINQTASPLRLSLSSTLTGEQVGFQLTNANLLGELDEEDHNQLYNTINRITEFTLEPLERKSIILSFLPTSFQLDDSSHEVQCLPSLCWWCPLFKPCCHQKHGDEDEMVETTRTSFTVKGEIAVTAQPLAGDGRTQKVAISPLCLVRPLLTTHLFAKKNATRRLSLCWPRCARWK